MARGCDVKHKFQWVKLYHFVRSVCGCMLVYLIAFISSALRKTAVDDRDRTERPEQARKTRRCASFSCIREAAT